MLCKNYTANIVCKIYTTKFFCVKITHLTIINQNQPKNGGFVVFFYAFIAGFLVLDFVKLWQEYSGLVIFVSSLFGTHFAHYFVMCQVFTTFALQKGD